MAVQITTEGKAEVLAQEVLTLARNTLLLHLRFLDAALSRLTPVPRRGADAEIFSTDGKALFYDPQRLLLAYRTERAAPARALLHTVLHCALRHFVPPEGAGRAVWDLACDAAAEYVCAGLAAELPSLAVERDARQKKRFVRLREGAGLLTAEKLYRWYLGQRLDPEALEAERALFRSDGHALWDAAENAPEVEREWRDVSRRMQIDLEAFTKRRGGGDALMLGLRAANREVSDYAGFLQKFAARSEPMRLDPDEFDYGLSSYGLRLYGGKVPLIEQIERRDTRRVREFYLAVEATRALPAEAIKAFLRQTWETLAAMETYLSKVRLWIAAGEREAVPVSNAEALEAYLESAVFPEGGTDFRPAFLRTEALLRAGKLENLRGVLCLTDGYGPFPAQMPSFPAAFIFVNEDYSTPEAPPWAIRLVLEKEAIYETR